MRIFLNKNWFFNPISKGKLLFSGRWLSLGSRQVKRRVVQNRVSTDMIIYTHWFQLFCIFLFLAVVAKKLILAPLSRSSSLLRTCIPEWNLASSTNAPHWLRLFAIRPESSPKSFTFMSTPLQSNLPTSYSVCFWAHLIMLSRHLALFQYVHCPAHRYLSMFTCSIIFSSTWFIFILCNYLSGVFFISIAT